MTNKLKTFFFGFLILTTVLSFVVRIVVLSDLSALGSEIKVLEKEAGLLNKENEMLKEEIDQLTALSNIRERAIAMGLAEASDTVFLVTPVTASVETNNF